MSDEPSGEGRLAFVLAYLLLAGARLREIVCAKLPRMRGEFARSTRAETSPKATATAAAGIVSSVGLVGLVEQYGVGGVLYATFLEIIGGIQSFGATITKPFTAFGDGIANVITAVFPARVISGAADYSLYSITQGQWAVFGPLTFAVGVAAVLAGMYVFMLGFQRMNLSLTGLIFNR
ncbi:hypothetical protein [Halolamina sp.]|uniref:hypothetical protein n=1 Tax=Halolamina sp. TaxID=1940283 RepID=UPI003561917F